MQILEMRGISKAFDGVPVLKAVDFDVEQGEIHALLGENGAGKSTLMNILGGLLPMDSGRVTFSGELLAGLTVRKAEALGIAFVHQELSLVGDLSAYENVFLGRELVSRLGRLRKKEMIARTRALFERLNVAIDPLATVNDLQAGQKQLLEIGKQLLFDAKLLILDEPTTALSNEEIDSLFAILRRLRAKGCSFIFISHKMPEVFAIADRYTVLRNGEMIARGHIKDTTPEDVARLMVGAGYTSADAYRARTLGEPVLEAENCSGRGFQDVTLAARRGEILALTGLQGAGADAFLRAAFGAPPPTGGVLRVFGQPCVNQDRRRMMRKSVAMLPSDRKTNSVLPDMSLLENMCVSRHALTMRRFYIRKKEEEARFKSYRALLNIRAGGSGDRVTKLSGGNQQKVFLARWLGTDADLFLLDNPTQGIDVGAKAELYQLILLLAEKGKTLLVCTQDIREIRLIADRCAVFYGGTVKKVLDHGEITEENVMLYATGTKEA